MVASAILIRESAGGYQCGQFDFRDECGNSVAAILAPQTPKSSAMPRAPPQGQALLLRNSLNASAPRTPSKEVTRS
jgi:hypothetical protein